jgi:hypothetical protein
MQEPPVIVLFYRNYNGSGFGSGFCSPEKWNLRSGSGPVLAKKNSGFGNQTWFQFQLSC